MKRDYPERPLVGIGVVIWRGEKALLVKRAKPPRAGQWSLPGGAQELVETVFAAARREAFEETGLRITVTGLVDVVDAIERDEAGRVRHHYTLIDVAAEAAPGEARAGSDAAAIRWVSLDDIAALELWDETARVIRLAARKRRA